MSSGRCDLDVELSALLGHLNGLWDNRRIPFPNISCIEVFFNSIILKILKYFIPIEKEYFHSFSTNLLTVYYMLANELHAWDTTENYLDKTPSFMENVF